MPISALAWISHPQTHEHVTAVRAAAPSAFANFLSFVRGLFGR